MAKLNPYLNFDGTCEEAFNFYKSVFGGEFTYLSRMGEFNVEGMDISDEDRSRVMHVSLPVGENILMGSDVPGHMKSQFKPGNNNYISLTPDSREEADRLFNELSVGGEVEMPMEEMFWGDYFGNFRDKYGIWWMINYPLR
ncbi:VOC family protein [Proteiniphilum sp. UBA1028]|jgi:PhnB protein|uniref:VOC family protein n=1 Tax=Proteiniphilum sp. UBA1028 TaxID=1947251 RepID=UPI000E817FAC|nr:VOC family protein [Proteiniphilum sp. UBA1028]HBG58318.1 VOC family protein [Porphyromonadaceae bacterium]